MNKDINFNTPWLAGQCKSPTVGVCTYHQSGTCYLLLLLLLLISSIFYPHRTKENLAALFLWRDLIVTTFDPTVDSALKSLDSLAFWNIYKANIGAHAVDDQSSNTFLCGKSRAISVAQHSSATWPERSLEPSSHSGSTLCLCCSTTLTWRNSGKGPCWHRTG